jgi:hypothetical protein
MANEIMFNFNGCGNGKCLACDCNITICQYEMHIDDEQHKKNVVKKLMEKKNRMKDSITWYENKIKTLDNFFNMEMKEPYKSTDEGWGGVNPAFY